MNPLLSKLHPYPFERLAKLKAGLQPPADLPHIPLGIGEPKHEPPEYIGHALRDASASLGSYPVAIGLAELREAASRWLTRRFGLPINSVDPETMILPVNGTREGIFSLVQATVDPSRDQLVMMPNPFYQIYEGATILAGASPRYLNCFQDNGFLPDLSGVTDAEWKRCALLFLCSPGNPTGAVLDTNYFREVIELADRFDFVVASDECYSDIYLDESSPPAGLLTVCRQLGRDALDRCVIFHSLSKRCSAPGLRSGFVAGDATIIRDFRLYRTYHGCAVPNATQKASIAAWDDDQYAHASRALYQEKFRKVVPILQSVLNVDQPAAAFYLWLSTPTSDETFAQRLFETQNVTALPGRYLSRSTADGDPGAGRIRISLVASASECVEAAHRIVSFCQQME